MSREKIFANSYKMFKHICNSWRSGNCLKNNEHNLITLIIRWEKQYNDCSLKYAREILNSFGSDILNEKTIKRCPKYIQDEIKRLKYSAMSKRKNPLKNGVYTISSALCPNSKRLDIDNASNANGANLQLWDKNLTNAQKFEFVKHDEGYYTIKSLCSGKMLDVCGGDQNPGANIHQWESNNTMAQNWYLVPLGNSYFKIISEDNLLSMDVDNAQTGNGTNIKCWWNNDSNAQKFKLRKVA